MIFILLDNQVAVLALRSGKAASSIWSTSLFHNPAKSVNLECKNSVELMFRDAQIYATHVNINNGLTLGNV